MLPFDTYLKPETRRQNWAAAASFSLQDWVGAVNPWSQRPWQSFARIYEGFVNVCGRAVRTARVAF
jgi:hypothetical protein